MKPEDEWPKCVKELGVMGIMHSEWIIGLCKELLLLRAFVRMMI